MAITAQNLFKALADPTRRSLFECLAGSGEHTVHALTLQAGVSQPAVSKHLAVLRAAGLVSYVRHGREAHYSVAPQAMSPLLDWMRVWHVS
jgi:DNA-binding transcriptional ArsR family regulator